MSSGYYNPRKPKKILPGWYETPVNPYFRPPPHKNPYFSPFLTEPLKKERESEYLELDIGSSVLWCKFCARSKCPCFREGIREKMVQLVEQRINNSNGRVVVDIFNPEYRWISGIVLLSHVGCQSFSNIDVPDRLEIYDYTLDPDFLEIL